MSSHIVNVLVRIVDALDALQQRDVEQALGRLPGVKHATVSQRTDHLLLIDYDPAATNSQHILAAVRGCGTDARLIGL